MTRIFGAIAAISTLMILLASCGAYWFAAANAKDTETAAASAVANSLAASLSQQLETLQNSVDGLAQSPDVIVALSSGDPELIKATATKLQTLVPFSIRLRLLLPNINDPDQSQLPHMGFGDLDMVRMTLTGKPKPVIQGESEHRHLAITSAVTHGTQVIGVVLASLQPDIAQKIISKTSFPRGLIELKQDQLLLGKTGDMSDKSNDPVSIEIKNSRWKIDTWTHFELGIADIGILSALIAIPALLTCLAFFVGHRKLSESFHQDRQGILKAAKDMFHGKNIGSYPMQLEEMQPIIIAMAQFKRVMEHEHSPSEEAENKENDFFNESFDIDFLEETTPVAMDQFQSIPISTSSMSVSMPSFESVKNMPVNVSEPEDNINISDVGMFDDYSMPTHIAETVEPTSTMTSWDMEFDTAVTEPLVTPSASFNSQHQTASPFREHDITGVIGENLTEALITDIGRAFASEALLLGVKTIVVASDARLSSTTMLEAVIKGILSTGCDVMNIGLVPAPVLYFVSHHSDGRSGVMVTGGRQPINHTGLKLLLNGALLSPTQIRNLKTRIDNHDYTQGQVGTVEENTLFSNEYIGVASEDCHLVRPMTVVVDCGNGATGQLGPMLLKTLGCDVIELYCDIDGRFPNRAPDLGGSTSLEALVKAVKLNNADLGVAFDGDGECLALVDSNGKIVSADQQMMLFARDVLAAKPASEIIYDTACSTHLPEQIKKRGGRGALWKSGSYALQTRLRETSAAMAGDMEGHFLFNDRWFGFSDALYAAVRMIEILSADMRSSSEMFNDLPNTLTTPLLNVPLATEDPVRFVEQMFSLAQFPDGDIVNTEGMRVEFPDGWGLVRASNDSCALIIRFEAISQEAMRRIQIQFKSLILQIKPDISLPF